jgi:hypothetical protein
MAEPLQLPLFPDRAVLIRIRPERGEARFYGLALSVRSRPPRRSPPGSRRRHQRPRPARPCQVPPGLPGPRRMTKAPVRQVAKAKPVLFGQRRHDYRLLPSEPRPSKGRLTLTDQVNRDTRRRRDVRPAALGRQSRNTLEFGQRQTESITQRQPARKRERPKHAGLVG